MANGGEPHKWTEGQQVMHRSQEAVKNPVCMIIVALGEHPETHAKFYNVQWVTDKGDLAMASVPELALTHWRSTH